MIENHITNLTIDNFKIHSHCNIEISDKKNVALVGKNGSGKTSILEAISLFSPGKGLISGSYNTIPNYNKISEDVFVSLKLANSYDLQLRIKNNQNNKELFINNKKQTKQTEVSNLLTIMWFTPGIQYEFTTSKTERRKVFDRMIFSLKSNHLDLLLEYDKITKERSDFIGNLSHNEIKSNKMLDILEQKIAEINYEIILNRLQITGKLNSIDLDSYKIKNSPINISINKDNEDKITLDSIDNHDCFIKNSTIELNSIREKDKYSGRSNFSLNKIDFSVQINNNSKIKQNSSGEQKMILLSIMMKNIILIKNQDKQMVFLGDEILSFLDTDHSNQLLNNLKEMKCQTLITAVEKNKNILEKYDFMIHETEL